MTTVIARSTCDEAIQTSFVAFWIASRSLSSGGHSPDPLARNDKMFKGVPMSDTKTMPGKIEKSEAEWRKELTPM